MKFIAVNDLEVKDPVATELGYLLVKTVCENSFDRENFEVAVKFLQRHPGYTSMNVYHSLIAGNDDTPLLAKEFFCVTDREIIGW